MRGEREGKPVRWHQEHEALEEPRGEPRTKAEYVRWLIAGHQVDDFPLGAEDLGLVPEDLPGEMPTTWAELYPE